MSIEYSKGDRLLACVLLYTYRPVHSCKGTQEFINTRTHAQSIETFMETQGQRQRRKDQEMLCMQNAGIEAGDASGDERMEMMMVKTMVVVVGSSGVVTWVWRVYL